ncbi:MAG: ribbon-helix-helix protein, CopG family [Desulfurococcaceae archaeon]
MSKRSLWLKLRISDEELDVLRQLARAEGSTVSDLIRKKLGLDLGRRVKKSVSRG